jgi:hypothetical protein
MVQLPFKHHSWIGDPGAGTGEVYDSTDGIDSTLYDYIPGFTNRDQGSYHQLGQGGHGAFTYTPPTGFNALANANLEEPTVLNTQDEARFVKLYTGDGAASNAQTGVGFQPNWIWIKNRDTTDHHLIHDDQRGAGKELRLNDSTVSEATNADGLLSFDTDGFTVGADVWYNTNTEDYAAMCLKSGAEWGFDIRIYYGLE